MAKLTRVPAKVFAASAAATEIGQFGSAVAGSKLETADVATIQGLSAWLDGWSEALVSGNRYPALQEMNGLLKVLSYQGAYALQEGIPEYDSATTYYIGSIVKKTGTFELYGSLTDDNVGNALTVDTEWKFLTDLSEVSTGALAISDYGTITTGITLATNTVSLAHVGGTLAITLPTTLVAGVENIVVFDFTTTSSSQPTISTSGTLKWSDKNGGKAPTAYSIISGVRNILTFKTHDGGVTWEAEYYTYGGVETAFTFPNLSASGTLGGSSAAIAPIMADLSGRPAYYAVDGNTSTVHWANSGSPSGNGLIWYNPSPFKVTQYNHVNSSINDGYGTYAPTAGTYYSSDDGTNWTVEQSFTNSATGLGASWSIAINTANQGYHKYRKLIVTATSNNYQPAFAEARPVGYTITT